MDDEKPNRAKARAFFLALKMRNEHDYNQDFTKAISDFPDEVRELFGSIWFEALDEIKRTDWPEKLGPDWRAMAYAELQEDLGLKCSHPPGLQKILGASGGHVTADHCPVCNSDRYYTGDGPKVPENIMEEWWAEIIERRKGR